MKLGLFRDWLSKSKTAHTSVSPSLTARDTTTHPESPHFSISYRNGIPDRLTVQVDWRPTDGTLLSTPGEQIFCVLQSRYPDLSIWRTSDTSLDTYIGNISDFSLSTAESMAADLQQSIYHLLDDWIWFKTMLYQNSSLLESIVDKYIRRNNIGK
jgi:hypothetical protein